MKKLIFSNSEESVNINLDTADNRNCDICESDSDKDKVFISGETDNTVCVNCVKQLNSFIKTEKTKKK